MLLRAAPLALQPGRVIVSLIAVLLVWSASWVFDRTLITTGQTPIGTTLYAGMAEGLHDASETVLSFEPLAAARTLHDRMLEPLWAQWSERPVVTALFLAVIAPIWCVGFGAVARMVALDVAAGLNLGVRPAIGYARKRWRSLVGGFFIPAAMLLGISIALGFFGWLLLNLPVLRVVGGLLYGVFLLAGFAWVLLLAGFGLAQAFTAPAVAADGADAVDSIQRAYAYLLGRPARAALYTALALIQWAAVYLVASAIVDLTIDRTYEMATAWLNEARLALLDTRGQDAGAAPDLIAWWVGAWRLLLIAFMVSFFQTSSTLLYLLLRRLNDDQDVREVWMPGVVEGTRIAER